MKQSKKHSAMETATNIGVGYVVALGSQFAVFPLFGIHVPLSSNIAMSLYFTGISIIRSYALRRYFTNKHHKNSEAS